MIQSSAVLFFCGAMVCRAQLSQPKSGSIEISPIVQLSTWHFPIISYRQQTSCEGGVCELIERQEAPIRYRPLFLPSLKSTPMEHLVSCPCGTLSDQVEVRKKKNCFRRACAFPFYELPTLLITWGWRWSDGLVEHK